MILKKIPTLLIIFLIASLFLLSGCKKPGEKSTDAISILSPYNEEVLKYSKSKFILRFPDMNIAESSEVLLNGKNIVKEFRWFSERIQYGGIITCTTIIDLQQYGNIGKNKLSVKVKKPNGEYFLKEIIFIYEPYSSSYTFSVRDKRTSQLMPAKLIFEGLEGTSNPNFSNTRSFKSTFIRNPVETNIILLRNGTTATGLPDGKYKVIATAGIFYTCDEKIITIPFNGSIDFHLEKAIDEPNYIPSDFHIHCAISGDSFEIPEYQIDNFLCANIKFIISSDHDALMDYNPIIKELGVEDRIQSAVGVEFSTKKHLNQNESPRSIGHWNTWPLKMKNAPPNYGALKQSFDVEPADIYEMYRRKANESFGDSIRGVVQLNHPRGIHFNSVDNIGRYHDYFEVNKYNPLIPLPKTYNDNSANSFLLKTSVSGKTKNIDFDLFELINRTSWKLYKEVRQDWFSLLNQGIFKPATGNTDSHSIIYDPAGFPQNLVYLDKIYSKAKEIPPEEIISALLKGRLTCTTGPVIKFSAKSSASGSKEVFMGDTIEDKTGKIVVNFRIDAVQWVNIDEARLIVNGKTFATYSLKDTENNIKRIEKKETIPISKDSWIIIEAGPKIEDDSPQVSTLYKTIAPYSVPMAFTNPIFIKTKTQKM